MRRYLERPHADIGENGRQPADYVAHCWEELELHAATRPAPENWPKPASLANGNIRRSAASGQA